MNLLEDPEVKKEVLRPEGKSMRGRIDELILQLERRNPTEEPIYSDGINGVWQVKYAGSYAPGTHLFSYGAYAPERELPFFLYAGGWSFGNALATFSSGFWGETLGVKAEDLKVSITAGRDVSGSGSVEFAGQMGDARHTAELLPLSGSRMSEEVLSVTLPEPVGTLDLPFQLRRVILVSYLDDEVMITRHESGLADVLVREVVPSEPVETEVTEDTGDGVSTS